MTQHNYFSIELPSRCKPYKNVDPSAIRVRAFTGGDEAILASASEKTLPEKIIDVLGRCLEGIDIKELTLGDKLFLMVWHAINSYSDGFSLPIICEHCLLKISVDYKLEDAEIKYLPDDFKEPISVSLFDGTIVNCRLVRVKDELYINKLEREINDNVYLHNIAVCIVDDSKDLIQKVDWLSNLSSKDVAKIRAVQDSYYHGVDFTMKYTCPKCQGRGTFIAPFRLDQILPYGDTLVKNFGIKV